MYNASKSAPFHLKYWSICSALSVSPSKSMVPCSYICTNRTGSNQRVVSSNSSKHMIKHSGHTQVGADVRYRPCVTPAHLCAYVCVIIVHTVFLTLARASTHQDDTACMANADSNNTHLKAQGSWGKLSAIRVAQQWC